MSDKRARQVIVDAENTCIDAVHFVGACNYQEREDVALEKVHLAFRQVSAAYAPLLARVRELCAALENTPRAVVGRVQFPTVSIKVERLARKIREELGE